MTVPVYIRNLWIAVMAGCVAGLGLLLVYMSHQALGLAAALERAEREVATCQAPPGAPPRPALPPPAPVRWTAADERALQRTVDALLQPADGRAR